MGYDFIIGRYIPSKNNQHMIVYYDKAWDETFTDYLKYEKKDFYQKLTVGDKILIIKPYTNFRNDIKNNHLYVFHGIKLSDGTLDDIPSKSVRYVDKDKRE